jgi:hypothetical protein
MAPANNFQKIFKQLGEPLKLAGKEGTPEGFGDQNDKAVHLFNLLYEAQSVAAELGWGDDLEWGEVLDDMIVE